MRILQAYYTVYWQYPREADQIQWHLDSVGVPLQVYKRLAFSKTHPLISSGVVAGATKVLFHYLPR